MEYDYIIVGSGFGGSVAAHRLTEKGYKVLLLEQGRKYEPRQFAKTNWNLHKWLWAPAMHCYGIQKLHFLRDVLILSGTGLGGGSLVYANTLLVPPDAFFNADTWKHLEKNWKDELTPFYETAEKMLGVVPYPNKTFPDKLLHEYGKEIGREKYFHQARVGIFFGEPGESVPDPFFDGRGPRRTGCTQTGHCMVGCRDGGKNSLDKNYLHLARQQGLEIRTRHKAVDIQTEGEGYKVTAETVTGMLGRLTKKKKTFTAKGVVMAAGVLGTLELLINCKTKGHLPNLSDKLGHIVRTNSEVLNGFTARRAKDFPIDGAAISGGLYIDDHTHIETVRYPNRSDVMSLLTAPMVDARGKIPRGLKYVGGIFRHPITFLRTLSPFGFAKKSIILLVMQTLDNHLTLGMKRKWWNGFKKTVSSVSLASRRERQSLKPTPTHINAANDAAVRMAEKVNGIPKSALSEVLFNTPVTAHILGGCVMGKDEQEGVIDKQHRVFGYENMLVVDGSMIPANLGVNPSLTITAMAERAMSFIPHKSSQTQSTST